MANSGFEGQMSLFDLMELSLPKKSDGTDVVSFVSRRKKVLDEKDSYLNRDDVLLTLAKERFEKQLSCLTLSEFDERLAALNLSSSDNAAKVASKIAQCIIRPLLSSIDSFTDDDSGYMLLRSAVDYDIEINEVKPDGTEWECHAVRGLRHKYRRSGDIIRLTLRETGYPDLDVYGYRTLSHPSGVCRDGRYKDGSQHADIALMLAYMVIYSRYMRSMGDADMRGVVAAALTDEHFQMNTVDEMFLMANDRAYVHLSGVTANELLSDHLTRAQVTVNYDRYMRISEPALDYFFEVVGADRDKLYTEPVCPDRSMRMLNNEAFRDGKSKPYRYLVNADMEWALLCNAPEEAWSKGVGKVRYNALLGRKTRAAKNRSYGEVIPPSWALPTTSLAYFANFVCTRAFHAIYEHDRQIVRVRSMLSEHSEHAKAYMTKKSIPSSVLKEMEGSVLNNYFGYVEFDESCDMDKVSAICDEFIAFHDTYLPNFDTSDVSIRFRKLGNHKAGGLFFPLYRCLCVDVGSPSSFIHEYGHCLDYSRCGSTYSSSADFYPLYTLYKQCVTDKVDGDDGLKGKLKRKGRKYDLDYYLSLNESFARCFELYVVKCLGVNNSICRQSKDSAFAYPEDEKLIEAIERYFSVLLSQYQHAAVEVA